jgi:membrane-bound serine protease (ClpP class)
VPDFDFSPGWFRVDTWIIVVLAIAVAAFIALAVQRGIRVHRRRVASGAEDLVGRTATVRAALRPRGTVFVKGELWAAVSGDGPAETGETVTITAVDNLVLCVVSSPSEEALKEVGE